MMWSILVETCSNKCMNMYIVCTRCAADTCIVI